MRKPLMLATPALAALLAAGCATDDEAVLRIDGVTPWAGDSVAANTVMQMVDPWPQGVESTRLLVPAVRAAPSATAKETADTGSSQSDDN